jgi:UDP-N-acetyl-D-galactosamine dehydrogenase
MNYKGDLKIAIIGLGYVGLPLATEFGKNFKTVGFDINSNRVEELKKGLDSTNEVTSDELISAKSLKFTILEDEIRESNFFIVTVPTPIDSNYQPDLTALKEASAIVGRCLKDGDIVVYESTVYPGLTEEVCVPILEQKSGMISNKDFFYGYSPERINPGDKDHRITDIRKITSGSTPSIAKRIDDIYSSIIKAGTYSATSVMVAEAAKVIENVQRDVNIALINELSIIFNELNIDTEEVLNAAGTKWNFHNYKPGLVGGHCIGVDPHYLTFKARQIGIEAKMITAGREMNEYMSKFVADRIISLMNQKGIKIESSRILILGFSFKENCPDFRNTKVVDLYQHLRNKGCDVDIYDPWVDKSDVMEMHKIEIEDEPKEKYYDALILAVAHNDFKHYSDGSITKLCTDNSVIFDMKHLLDSEIVDGRL